MCGQAFISDTLWRLYQSAESGLEIQEDEAMELFHGAGGPKPLLRPF